VPCAIIVKLCAAVGALAMSLPVAAASASSGATSVGGLGYGESQPTTVFADGSTLVGPAGSLVGRLLRFHGTLAGSRPGDLVTLQRLRSGVGWIDAASATVAADGSFDAAWRARAAGHTQLRVVPGGPGAPATVPVSLAATATAGSAPVISRPVTVYQPARATWYGPGFWGRRTACGIRLARTTLGVAHRKLPCGTLVQLYKGGRTVTVPVIDRGRFRPGTTYDLTQATATALGVRTTTTIGVIRAPTRTATT
jgi:hypothetical protein